MNEPTYLGNPNLKRANVQQEWTKKELLEYKRCMDDPLYFIQTYVKIVSLDEGLIPFKMYNFQKYNIISQEKDFIHGIWKMMVLVQLEIDI